MTKNASLDRVDSIYRVANISQTTNLSVESTELQKLYRAYRKLKALTYNDGAESVWSEPTLMLSKYLYSLLLSPIPFNTPEILDDSALESIWDRLRIFEGSSTEGAAVLKVCIETAQKLRTRSDNPLFLAMRQAFPRGVGRGALLIQHSALIPTVEKLLRKSAITSGISVVTAHQLKGSGSYERLLIVGPLSWYPGYVTRSKRSMQNVVLRFAWLNDRVAPTNSFVGGWAVDSESADVPEARIQPKDEGVDSLPEDFLAPVDWTHIHRRGLRHSGDAQEIDRVPAKTLLLEGEFGVFLEDDPSVAALVIDLDAEDAQRRVARISVNKLEPGQFVILKRHGEPDFTVAFANQLMGGLSVPLRALQAEWKQRLRRRVEESSLLAVSIALLDLGSTRAMEANVRNWISARNIRTQDQEDFRAILKLVGLNDVFEEYWNGMEAIARYHQRAGQQIRRLLLRKLQESAFVGLERYGRLDITLTGAVGAGTLTAFRILAIDRNPRVVNVNELNSPFPIGGDYGANAPLQHI